MNRVRIRRGRVYVTCPRGHNMGSAKTTEWAGSWLEARAGDPNGCSACPPETEKRAMWGDR